MRPPQLIAVCLALWTGAITNPPAADAQDPVVRIQDPAEPLAIEGLQDPPTLVLSETPDEPAPLPEPAEILTAAELVAQITRPRPMPEVPGPPSDWPDPCRAITVEERERGGSYDETAAEDSGRSFDEQWAVTAVGVEVDNARLRRLQDIAAQKYLEELPRIGLDLVGFANDVATVLDGNVMGYAVMVKRGLEPAVVRTGGWARAPRDGGVPFSAKTSLHLASTSKTITALALVRLMREVGVSLDEPIADYLPDYWQVGPGVGSIRFRDLLEHRTGLGCPGAGSPSFEWARVRVGRGVAPNVTPPPAAGFDYENLHYTLLRILMPTVSGQVETACPQRGQADGQWNACTSAFYDAYVQSIVLRPSEVHSAKLDPRDNTALAYLSANVDDTTNTGWDSGPKRGRAGPIGWHATPEELLRLARAVRSGVVVTPDELASMQTSSRGFLYDSDFSPIGVYRHGGTWGTGNPGKRESNIMYFAPDDVNIVIFMNSPMITSPGAPANFVFQAYAANYIGTP